ncbi:MAG: Fe2+-dependent dioxygenase [Oxalicibacterium faecigallinarum]|uniref:Fe2+-dependent dioxygenase n=1 Tax=Oxalicibacterium faecigallinarum TaxID=573741 RepID=UPI00280803E1|nr:Fe2+-dependent dioxygenase [Oxalicibacterium faecigallinarum]MDQ7970511.1 Fe2+-dependent dioxygenase [Oxalicibacterium faecigallinarum]
MMLHIPEVLTTQEVAAIRQQLDQTDWVDGRATVGEQGARVKRNQQLPEPSAVGRELGEKILQRLIKQPLFLSAAIPYRYVPPLFNRYEGGEHYGFHVDGSIRTIPGTNLNLRTDLSCTLFLCDPEEYDGGELIVSDTYGEHEVKLPAGDMILYPSSSLHKVEPVTRGARVCSFFWVQSMVPDDGRRTMLYELDQNIQKLRAQIGDTSEVLGLTGHYHNLLRQWAQI